MGHVLLVKNRFPFGNRTREPDNHLVPIRLMPANDLLRSRMRQAGFPEIMGIEGLVANERIMPVAPRAHEGRGNVSRPGPHGNVHIDHSPWAHGLPSVGFHHWAYPRSISEIAVSNGNPCRARASWHCALPAAKCRQTSGRVA